MLYTGKTLHMQKPHGREHMGPAFKKSILMSIPENQHIARLRERSAEWHLALQSFLRILATSEAEPQSFKLDGYGKL